MKYYPEVVIVSENGGATKTFPLTDTAFIISDLYHNPKVAEFKSQFCQQNQCRRNSKPSFPVGTAPATRKMSPNLISPHYSLQFSKNSLPTTNAMQS